MLLPTVVGIGLNAGVNNFLERDRWNAIAFLGVKIPLTQWWYTSHKLKEHDIKIQEAELMRDDLQQKMKLQKLRKKFLSLLVIFAHTVQRRNYTIVYDFDRLEFLKKNPCRLISLVLETFLNYLNQIPFFGRSLAFTPVTFAG